MHTDTLIEAIEIAAKHPFVKAMDIDEIDSIKDIRDMTSKTAAYLLLNYIEHKQ